MLVKVGIVFASILIGILVGFWVPIFAGDLPYDHRFGRCGYDIIAPLRDFNGFGVNPLLMVSSFYSVVFGVCGLIVGVILVKPLKYSYLVPTVIWIAVLVCAGFCLSDLKWLALPCEGGDGIADDGNFSAAQYAVLPFFAYIIYALVLAPQAFYCAWNYRRKMKDENYWRDYWQKHDGLDLSEYAGNQSISASNTNTKQ